MSYPPVFTYAKDSPSVLALLGTNPTRFWPFGTAPQNETRPYAVHQLVYGSPENALSCPADIDLIGIQIDAYGKNVSGVRSIAEALRQAMEPHGHVVSLNGESWEQATGLWRSSFTVEFWADRSAS